MQSPAALQGAPTPLEIVSTSGLEVGRAGEGGLDTPSVVSLASATAEADSTESRPNNRPSTASKVVQRVTGLAWSSLRPPMFARKSGGSDTSPADKMNGISVKDVATAAVDLDITQTGSVEALRTADRDDRDGKISRAEFAEMLKKADRDGNGKIDSVEFAQFGQRYLDSRKSLSESQARNRQLKLFSLILSVVCFVQTCLLAVVVVVVTFAFKDAYVQESAVTPSDGASVPSMPMMTGFRGESVIGVREALTSMPLWAAPALPLEQLQRVKTMQVSYTEAAGVNSTRLVQSLLHVAEVRRRNATDVSFVTLSAGRSIVVTNGRAFLEQPAAVVSPAVAAELSMQGVGPLFYRSPLCAADTSCSAFEVDGGDIATVLEKASSDLRAIGVTPPDASPVGRQLQEVTYCPDGEHEDETCAMCCKDTAGCHIEEAYIGGGTDTPKYKCIAETGGGSDECSRCEVPYPYTDPPNDDWCGVKSLPADEQLCQNDLSGLLEGFGNCEVGIDCPLDVRSLEPPDVPWCAHCNTQSDPEACCKNAYLYWQDAPPHSISKCHLEHGFCRMDKAQVYKCNSWPALVRPPSAPPPASPPLLPGSAVCP